MDHFTLFIFICYCSSRILKQLHLLEADVSVVLWCSQIIEYGDGTPATQSQLAKDIGTFLKWAAEPEHDTRKQMLIKVRWMYYLIFFFILSFKP